MGNGTLITLMGEPNVNYDSKSSERERTRVRGTPTFRQYKRNLEVIYCSRNKGFLGDADTLEVMTYYKNKITLLKNIFIHPCVVKDHLSGQFFRSGYISGK